MADTRCPRCGGPGLIVLGTGDFLTLYQCQECRYDYEVHWKACWECGEWIDDEYEYCEMHGVYNGDLLSPRQDRLWSAEPPSW